MKVRFYNSLNYFKGEKSFYILPVISITKKSGVFFIHFGLLVFFVVIIFYE